MEVPDRSKTFVCGEKNTLDHSLVCKKEGLVSNTTRDSTAHLLPQDPLGQRCSYCFLSIQAREQAGLPLPPKESAVECSFAGKEPTFEYEVERMKCEKMKK